MAYPAGVQLATLTFSNPITFLGTEASGTEVTVQPTAGVVWAATGQPIDDFPEIVNPGTGLPGSLTVPFTDQPGFTDHAGNAFTGWAYVVTRKTTFRGSMPKTVRKSWQPVLGQTVVDFDNIPGGSIGLPVSAPVVPVTSVAGLTGLVGAEDLAGALDPFLPDGVTLESVEANLPERLAAEALAAGLATKLDADLVGAASGVAPLGADSKVPDASLPARLGATALNATIASEGKKTLAPKRGNSIVLFGHSIVEYNEPTTVAGPPPEHNIRSDGWFRWLNIFLRQRFTLMGVHGYAGYTVAQLKAVTGPAKTSGASYVMFHGVINSLTAGVTSASIIADLDIIVQDFLNNGQALILCTEWPATTLTTTAQKDAHEAVNRWIVAQATRPGVIVIPWHQVVTDVTVGGPRTGVLADGTHPLTYGAMLTARAASAILGPVVPNLADGALIATNASQNNAITNGMMLGTAGTKVGAGMTGTVADGWQLEAVNSAHIAVGSKVARADGFGEWQQIQITGGSGSANGGTLLTRTPNLPAGWAVGDQVFAEFEFETDADFVNASTFELIIWGLTSGSTTNQTEWTLRNSNGTTDVKRLGGISGIVRTDPMTLLTGTAKLQFRLMLNLTSGAPAATIRIGRVRLGRVL